MALSVIKECISAVIYGNERVMDLFRNTLTPSLPLGPAGREFPLDKPWGEFPRRAQGDKGTTSVGHKLTRSRSLINPM